MEKLTLCLIRFYREDLVYKGDCHKTLNIRAINKEDIQKPIAKIEKSFRNDNVSDYFLKIPFLMISGSLVQKYNVFIETSTFADTWKIA